MNFSNIETSNYRAGRFVRDHLNQTIHCKDERKLKTRKINMQVTNIMSIQITRPSLGSSKLECSYRSLPITLRCQSLVIPPVDQFRLGNVNYELVNLADGFYSEPSIQGYMGMFSLRK
jgi:hypothetical protein